MPILNLQDVSRDFGGVRAVDGVVLELERGELRVLAGPNGCGKSTLFHLITGALRPSHGRIEFDGTDVTGLPPRRLARMGIRRKFQTASVFDDLTVAENMAVGAWGADGRRSRRVGTAEFEQVGLASRASARAGDLSHGERQWLEIGMVLAARPRLLLLDEPTAGMTERETHAAVDVIRSLASAGGVTTLVIEHDMRFVERLDCAVTAMARGRVLLTGSFEEIRADPRVRAQYFGEAAEEAA